MRGILFACLLAGGCKSNQVDVTSHLDLSVIDLATPPDLFMCGPTRDTGVESKSVLNTLTAPQDRTQFSFDLNGDGRMDNQYGNIMGALTANNEDGQPTLTAAVQGGNDLLLIDATASAFTGDACAAAKVLFAGAQASPDFGGSGHFTVASSPAPVSFPGAFGSSGFSTEPAAEPISLPVLLPFATVLVPVTLIDAHLTFSVAGDGTPTHGQINGALRASDVTGTFLPEVARQLNDQVIANPTSAQSVPLLQIFDIGCSGASLNFDGTAAAKDDGKIASCEVSDNSIIKNVVTPDVQLFDSGGNFAPNPSNTTKDSLSVGLGFTAVRATF